LSTGGRTLLQALSRLSKTRGSSIRRMMFFFRKGDGQACLPLPCAKLSIVQPGAAVFLIILIKQKIKRKIWDNAQRYVIKFI
jgi:hypothetical protein